MIFLNNIHSSVDARKIARRKLPWMVFDYFDGAASEGQGEVENRRKLHQLKLQPRILRNVEHRSLKASLFGEPADLPFGISPMGMCNLSAPGADLMLAKLAAERNIPVGVSTAASTNLEKMFETSKGKAWFQLYYGGDDESSFKLVNRVQDCGYDKLILTVDVPEVGRRPRELRRGFKMPFRIGVPQFIDFALHPVWSLSTLYHGKPELANFGGDFGEFNRTASRAGADWQFFDKIREMWKGKLIVKGVLSVEDSAELVKRGVDAIQVSSHGGRQLDSGPLPIDALPEIRKQVGPDFPLFYDSGIRSGEDIIKAYALGADFVFIGRPFLFAIAAMKERGLTKMCDVFRDETSIALAQIALTGMDQIDEQVIVNF